MRSRCVVLARVGLMAIALFGSGCSSDDTPPPQQSQAQSQKILLKDCDSPSWKQENLGLWYSVCRPPMRW